MHLDYKFSGKLHRLIIPLANVSYSIVPISECPGSVKCYVDCRDWQTSALTDGIRLESMASITFGTPDNYKL